MKVSYDKSADAVYIYIKQAVVSESKEKAPGIFFDYDENGEVIGIEILNTIDRGMQPRKLEMEML
jgi:uncharacterized protein YuzE